MKNFIYVLIIIMLIIFSIVWVLHDDISEAEVKNYYTYSIEDSGDGIAVIKGKYEIEKKISYWFRENPNKIITHIERTNITYWDDLKVIIFYEIKGTEKRFDFKKNKIE